MKSLHRSIALGFSILFGASLPPVHAATVSFWFGGHITEVNDVSNALPFAVTGGMPFTGRVTYDAALVTSTGGRSFPGGSSGQYYFETVAGCAMQLQIGGHVVANADAQPGTYTAEIFVGDNANNEDVLLYSALGGGGTLIDGNHFVVPPRFSTIDLDLADSTKLVLGDSSLPTAVPALAEFGNRREMRWHLSIDDGNPTHVFRVVGEVTAVGTNELVFLSQTRVGTEKLRLSWPAMNPGFSLQVCTNLTTGVWQNVAEPVLQSSLEYSVTVSSAGSYGFYRLKK